MTRENSDTFNPLIHFVVPDVPDPGPDGKFPVTTDPEQHLVVVAEVRFSFYGRRTQAAKFADQLQKRLRVEVDASTTVSKIQIVSPSQEVHDALTRGDNGHSGRGNGDVAPFPGSREGGSGIREVHEPGGPGSS